jgi:DHA1 family tetracycline resistance protein-like MFS transporter
MKWKNPLVPILLIIFVDVLGLGILLPVLPYFASAYSASPFEIGLLMSAFPAAMLIGAPVLGRLSDRYGRRPMLLASLFGTFAGYVLLAVANSLPLMFVSRLIDGFTGGNIPIAQAYIADVVEEKKRAQAYGLIGATFGMGYIFGPALGGGRQASAGRSASATRCPR